MSHPSGFRMTDHNAWSIHRSGDCSFSLFLCDQQLRPTLGFFVRVLECLSHVDFRFQCEIVTITSDVCRTHMLQPAAGRLFHEFDNVARSLDIHPKDLIAIFFLEGQRSGTMPHLVRGRQDLLFSGLAQTKTRQRNIALKDFEVLKLRYAAHITQNGLDAVSRWSTLRATKQCRNTMTILEQTSCKMAAEESRSACDQNVFTNGHLQAESFRSSRRWKVACRTVESIPACDSIQRDPCGPRSPVHQRFAR